MLDHLPSSMIPLFQIYVRSTNIDRALMSAVSVMSGFYPTSDEQRRITGLPQQPVPIHTVPDDIDYVSNNCPLDAENKTCCGFRIFDGYARFLPRSVGRTLGLTQKFPATLNIIFSVEE